MFVCLSLDSIANVDRRYYPQLFLEDYKYAVKKKRKEINTINEKLNFGNSDDESVKDKSNESDEDKYCILILWF